MVYPSMPLIDEIGAKFAADTFEFSRHAVDQSIGPSILVLEVKQAIAIGSIIKLPDLQLVRRR